MRSTPRPARPSDTCARSQVSSETGPCRSVERHLVQRLADVAQVGEPAVATDLAPAPARAGRPTLAASSTAATPRWREELDPGAQRLGDLVGEVVAARVELLGGVAEEAGERRRPDPRAAVRLLERLQQGQPLERGRGREHAPAAGDHRRHADLQQRLAYGGQVGVAIADHRDVAWSQRLTLEGRPGREQTAYVEGEVLARRGVAPGRR